MKKAIKDKEAKKDKKEESYKDTLANKLAENLQKKRLNAL